MAVVDLDGSGKSSYALALLQHEQNKTVEKLILVTARENQTLVAAAKVVIPAVVWRGPPGVYTDFFSRHQTRSP